MNLGSPIGKRYRWTTTLNRADWTSPAGIFFRLRKDKPNETRFGFHAIELKSISANESQLLWTAHRAEKHSEPLVLAEAFGDLKLSRDSSCTFEIALGRSGFPEVRINDRAFPKSDWVVSKEARDLIVTSLDQLPTTYAGRIGVFHHEGRTTSLASQIMYLEN